MTAKKAMKPKPKPLSWFEKMKGRKVVVTHGAKTGYMRPGQTMQVILPDAFTSWQKFMGYRFAAVRRRK